jgi:fatty acid desaturase
MPRYIPWYRHRSDIPASALVFCVFAIQLWCFFSISDPRLLAGIVTLLMLIQVSCGAVCHNHHHVNIFTRPWANRLIETVMYLQTGTSAFSWTIHHNIGHHGDYLDQDKDPASWQEADGSAMHRLKYDFYNAFMIYPEIWKIGRHHPPLFARFKRWFLIGNMVLLGLLLINPVNALIVFVLPMAIMLVVLLDNTFQQHSGLATHDHHLASRNVEHAFYNLTSWNLGYHTAHHIYPGIHWSQLPQLHARLRHRIPDVLISKKLIPDLKHDIPTTLPEWADA